MCNEPADHVRVVVPDVDDPDHRYLGVVGTVEEVHEDDLGGLTDDPRDDYFYRVDSEDKALERISFQHHDLRRVE